MRLTDQGFAVISGNREKEESPNEEPTGVRRVSGTENSAVTVHKESTYNSIIVGGTREYTDSESDFD